MFTLCKTCATEQSKEPCQHSGPARWLEGTWCTPELHEAVNQGYQVKEINEVWHWKEHRLPLFAGYINTFLKAKMEASGWPDHCETMDDKIRYLAEVKHKDMVELDMEKVESNPGRKAVAKLMLNSFWGKFGMRDNLSKTEFIYKPKDFYQLLRSKSRKVQELHLVNENCMMVTHSSDDDYNEGNSSSNIAIAAITTSHARLRLLKMLNFLADRILYCDTDSVIYVRYVNGLTVSVVGFKKKLF